MWSVWVVLCAAGLTWRCVTRGGAVDSAGVIFASERGGRTLDEAATDIANDSGKERQQRYGEEDDHGGRGEKEERKAG